MWTYKSFFQILNHQKLTMLVGLIKDIIPPSTPWQSIAHWVCLPHISEGIYEQIFLKNISEIQTWVQMCDKPAVMSETAYSKTWPTQPVSVMRKKLLHDQFAVEGLQSGRFSEAVTVKSKFLRASCIPVVIKSKTVEMIWARIQAHTKVCASASGKRLLIFSRIGYACDIT